MFTDTITYEDFNGEIQKKTIYFNISKMEAMRLEADYPCGYSAKLNSDLESNNVSQMLNDFEQLVKISYGVKSDDGKRFIKNEEVWIDFKESPAYDEFMMKLMTEEDYALRFIIGTLPKTDETPEEIQSKISSQMAERKLELHTNQ